MTNLSLSVKTIVNDDNDGVEAWCWVLMCSNADAPTKRNHLGDSKCLWLQATANELCPQIVGTFLGVPDCTVEKPWWTGQIMLNITYRYYCWQHPRENMNSPTWTLCFYRSPSFYLQMRICRNEPANAESCKITNEFSKPTHFESTGKLLFSPSNCFPPNSFEIEVSNQFPTKPIMNYTWWF